MSGSVGVLSEAIHSFLDLISASVSFYTVREAIKPADEDHPYGHGKIETISSLFEALLLVLAAGLIIYEAIEHLMHPHAVQYQGLAMLVMLISLGVSYFAFRHNLAAARATESSALHVNALHFLSDVLASAGVLLGLILLRLTGWQIIDPLIGVAVAVYILAISVKQVKRALLELSDSKLPHSEVQEIRAMLESFQAKTLDVHDLRTRKSGVTRHIDFHLVVCGHSTVDDSHQVCDQMEMKIVERFPQASVNIHVEPCETKRTECSSNCHIYHRRLSKKRPSKEDE